MSKTKSIICLSVLAVVMLFLGVFSVIPSFQVGIYDYNSPLSQIELGLDLKGGVSATFEVDEESAEGLSAAALDEAIENTVNTMKSRLDALGISDATVARVSGSGMNGVKVEIPQSDNVDNILDVLSSKAELEIRLLSADGEIITDASNIISAVTVSDPNNDGYYAIQLQFNSDGRNDMADATSGLNYGTDSIYFLLDGEVISQATVSEQVDSEYSLISGNMSYETAQAIAVQINYGAYDVAFSKQFDQNTISPVIGDQALQFMLIAAAVFIVAAIVYMIVVYGMYGVASGLSLLAYTILTILALAYLPFVKLTMAGIAGIAMGLVLAVGSDILIMERIREEFRSGKSFRSSYESGFKKSLPLLIDIHAVALIVTVVLWVFVGSITQGFAVTMICGIVLSLFASLAVTRMFARLFMPVFGETPSLYKLKKQEVEQ